MGRRSPMADILPSEEAKASNGESKTGEAAGEAAAPLTTAQRLAASNSAAAQAEILPDPYAKEAKHFTEVRVLNRDVRASVYRRIAEAHMSSLKPWSVELTYLYYDLMSILNGFTM